MNLVTRDLKVIWHPYSAFGGKQDLGLKGIVRGKGAWLWDEKGNKILDAISSWWVNIHGHCHPYIIEKIEKQLAKLEHFLFAGFTHEPAVALAEKLLEHLPANQSKVFFSDNGSTAVEAALKIAIQYWHN